MGRGTAYPMVSGGASGPIFIEPKERFRCRRSSRDLIMIPPGTGVRPYRASAHSEAQGPRAAMVIFGARIRERIPLQLE